MPTWKATGCANPNIAFIKYWGNRDDALRLPVNGSISMNLDGIMTQTTVEFDPTLATDSATIDNKPISELALGRISQHLDRVRKLAKVSDHAIVTSVNNFPSGAGIASSASAFAALSLASAAALGLALSEWQLSALARLGSGSASRSIPGGFVEWHVGETHEQSFAETFVPADHWHLTDFIAIVSSAHKRTGSTEGHALANTSPLQPSRVQSVPQRLALCKQAILDRDFEKFADVVELDSNVMHGVMMTSTPSLFYWMPETLALMESVRHWRAEGIAVCYTIDAGPNVHCICAPGHEQALEERLSAHPGILEIKKAGPGGPASLID
jgi:diphosphomevalonate decarboxylase